MSLGVTEADYKKALEEKAFLEKQIDELAAFIMREYPSEPGKNGSEGAVECAIRLLSEKKH
jgi:hypothetical protein